MDISFSKQFKRYFVIYKNMKIVRTLNEWKWRKFKCLWNIFLWHFPEYTGYWNDRITDKKNYKYFLNILCSLSKDKYLVSINLFTTSNWYASYVCDLNTEYCFQVTAYHFWYSFNCIHIPYSLLFMLKLTWHHTEMSLFNKKINFENRRVMPFILKSVKVKNIHKIKL